MSFVVVVCRRRCLGRECPGCRAPVNDNGKDFRLNVPLQRVIKHFVIARPRLLTCVQPRQQPSTTTELQKFNHTSSEVQPQTFSSSPAKGRKRPRRAAQDRQLRRPEGRSESDTDERSDNSDQVSSCLVGPLFRISEWRFISYVCVVFVCLVLYCVFAL